MDKEINCMVRKGHLNQEDTTLLAILKEGCEATCDNSFKYMNQK